MGAYLDRNVACTAVLHLPGFSMFKAFAFDKDAGKLDEATFRYSDSVESAAHCRAQAVERARAWALFAGASVYIDNSGNESGGEWR